MDCKIIVLWEPQSIKIYLKFLEYIRAHKKVIDEMKAQRAFNDMNFTPDETDEFYNNWMDII